MGVGVFESFVIAIASLSIKTQLENCGVIKCYRYLNRLETVDGFAQNPQFRDLWLSNR